MDLNKHRDIDWSQIKVVLSAQWGSAGAPPFRHPQPVGAVCQTCRRPISLPCRHHLPTQSGMLVVMIALMPPVRATIRLHFGVWGVTSVGSALKECSAPVTIPTTVATANPVPITLGQLHTTAFR